MCVALGSIQVRWSPDWLVWNDLLFEHNVNSAGLGLGGFVSAQNRGSIFNPLFASCVFCALRDANFGFCLVSGAFFSSLLFCDFVVVESIVRL